MERNDFIVEIEEHAVTFRNAFLGIMNAFDKEVMALNIHEFDDAFRHFVETVEKRKKIFDYDLLPIYEKQFKDDDEIARKVVWLCDFITIAPLLSCFISTVNFGLNGLVGIYDLGPYELPRKTIEFSEKLKKDLDKIYEEFNTKLEVSKKIFPERKGN